MNAYIAELRERFDALEAREQTALVVLGGFLAILVFYFTLWTPAYDYLEDSQVDHDRHLKLLTYLQSTEAEARAAAQGGAKPSAGRNLLTSVSRTAQTVGINPSRMQPEGSGAVSVWFEAVPFTQLMLWLERLESQQGIVVRQISIDRRDEPGQVTARLVLRS